ncbi:hypothetical protein G9A89_006215 [Geosiphon pyriformis]|nr:hypothetical protein G9A89_006215 [Geosiphon pyriformis]
MSMVQDFQAAYYSSLSDSIISIKTLKMTHWVHNGKMDYFRKGEIAIKFMHRLQHNNEEFFYEADRLAGESGTCDRALRHNLSRKILVNAFGVPISHIAKQYVCAQEARHGNNAWESIGKIRQQYGIKIRI